MENLPVSVCVITLNEEDNIGRCLDSVQWADDILVVDSGSEDRTREIAEQKGARVLHKDWPGMIEQKQYATDQAEYDWVFNLDADEWVDNNLMYSIEEQFNTNPKPGVSFQIIRKSKYLGQWLEHGSWYPDQILRLFNRRETTWEGYDPHAHLHSTETIKQLDGHLLHEPYEDLRDHLSYINDYTDTMAEKKDEKGETGSITDAITHSAFKLFKEMILKQGFLDGKQGFVAAGMSSWYVFLKYAKLWERQQVSKDE